MGLQLLGSIPVLLMMAFAGVAPAKDLVIERAMIHQIEDGPPIEAGYEFLPGETAWLSFRVAGFAVKEKDKDEEINSVQLHYTIRVTDPSGIPALQPFSGTKATDVRREDKDWVPKIRREIVLPEFAVRGKYTISLAVKDGISGAEASKDVTLQVRNKEVAPSEELVARNFGFYRSEEARRPLTEVVYRVGESIFVRMDVVGYVIESPKNAFSVEYGLRLTGPDGKPVVDQPVAATETFESFYPRRWLPIAFRLDLPSNGLKGEHQLTVQVRDKIAGKSLEIQKSFTVE